MKNTGIKRFRNSKYFVSKQGKVYWFSKVYKTFKEMKPSVNKTGYIFYVLIIDGERNSYLIHRLVAETHMIDWNGRLNVHHIDGNKQNNRIENLELLDTKSHFEKHNGYCRYKLTDIINNKEIILNTYKEIVEYCGLKSRRINGLNKKKWLIEKIESLPQLVIK